MVKRQALTERRHKMSVGGPTGGTTQRIVHDWGVHLERAGSSPPVATAGGLDLSPVATHWLSRGSIHRMTAAIFVPSAVLAPPHFGA
jgi:hypothetical protein